MYAIGTDIATGDVMIRNYANGTAIRIPADDIALVADMVRNEYPECEFCEAAIDTTLADLRDRLMRADRELAYIRRNSEPLSVERLDGKIAGVRLALSYVDEALRMAKPAEEPQP
jgi:hypothetical protein